MTGPAPDGTCKGSVLAGWLSTTDHKVIGHLHLITSLGFFMIAGLMAMIMCVHLMGPDYHLVSDQAPTRPRRLGRRVRTCRVKARVKGSG